jgi:hypothetical protein
MRPVLIGVLMTAVLLLPGCATRIAGTPQPDLDCAEVAAPLVDINPQARTEPELRIPQPPGWERADRLSAPTIEFVMVNTDLTSGRFTPNVVVTLEPIRDQTVSAAEIFDDQLGLLETQLGATVVTAEAGLQCGFPARYVTYTAPGLGPIPGRQSDVLCVVADSGGDTYLATVTVSSTDPDDETYAADVDEIITGFAVTPRG